MKDKWKSQFSQPAEEPIFYKVHQEFVGNFDPSSSASRRIHEAPVCITGSGKKLLPKRQIWYQMDGHCLKTGLFPHTSLTVQGHKRYLKETNRGLILEVKGKFPHQSLKPQMLK